MNIFLIGSKGCGKTTLSRKLAERLDMDFIDLDHYIEAKEKRTIPQIYTKSGELEFRKKECDAIQEVTREKNAIISTGGGAPSFCDNMNLMNEHGLTIYLKVSVPELVRRVSATSAERPILKGKNASELEQYIAKTLKEREPFYNMAKIIIEGDNTAVEDILLQLKKFL